MHVAVLIKLYLQKQAMVQRWSADLGLLTPVLSDAFFYIVHFFDTAGIPPQICGGAENCFKNSILIGPGKATVLYKRVASLPGVTDLKMPMG